ncbi:MAG: hypothetical protein Tsb0020_48590 [Haliangiales bacterium]
MNVRAHTPRLQRLPGQALSLALLGLLLLPIAALLLSSSPADVSAGMAHRLFWPALALTMRTTLISLALIILTGTPLAWWLATTSSRRARVVEIVVDIPIVIPPAVIGVALLQALGRRGLLGPLLDQLGIAIPFTSAAVVIAQIVVAAPFYVQAAATAFRKVDADLLLTARTLGASPASAFLQLAVPIALPGLSAGAALAWARSLGEFGATLLFAGNLTGTTQTMPLAIYTALESDVRAALAIALVLAGVAVVLLFGLRVGPGLWSRWRRDGGYDARAASPGTTP